MFDLVEWTSSGENVNLLVPPFLHVNSVAFFLILALRFKGTLLGLGVQ